MSTERRVNLISDSKKSRDEIVLAILEETISNAVAKADFYRRRVPHDFVLSKIQDLKRIPVLSRKELVSLSREILFTTSTPPDIIGLTSGTTYSNGKGILYRVHSKNERAVAQAVFEAVSDTITEKPVTLRLINANHGIEFFDAARGLLSVPFEQPYHFWAIVDLLKSRFSFSDFEPHITSIASPLLALKVLTVKLQENAIQASQFNVRNVISFAWRLTPYWQQRIESYWSVPVIDTYGLSEVPGLCATKCNRCGYFHFGSAGIR